MLNNLAFTSNFRLWIHNCKNHTKIMLRGHGYLSSHILILETTSRLFIPNSVVIKELTVQKPCEQF